MLERSDMLQCVGTALEGTVTGDNPLWFVVIFIFKALITFFC